MKIFNNKSECCGCMACVDSCPKNAIKVKYDYQGFLYPRIDQKLCVECGKCKTVCAFQNGMSDNMSCEKEVYACKHKNDDERKNSSSGGIYTAISDYILKSGGVVYGAAYESKNKVVHIRCTTEEQRNLTRGSKYVQSDMQGVYGKIKEDLADGKKVLFTGTPCQCAQVKKLMRNFENLYLVDIICHGVPSPRIFEEHISYIEKESKKQVKEFLFRAKSDVRIGKNQYSSVIFDDQSKDTSSAYIQVFFNIFNENKILRPGCFRCKYANKNRMGDVTIGDFWGVEKVFPEFDDRNGISAVIANTQKGKELLKEIAQNIETIETDYDTVSKHNPNLLRPSKVPDRNWIFWSMYLFGGYKKLIHYYTKSTFLKKCKTIVGKIIKH